jgi:hypothetical protein
MIEHNEDEVHAAASALASTMTVAEIGSDVTAWAFERLISGDHAAHDILSKDKGNRTSGREKALFLATGSIAEERIAEAATGLASLWLTAWIRAGKPDLPPSAFDLPQGIAPEPVRGDDELNRSAAPKPEEKEKEKEKEPD